MNISSKLEMRLSKKYDYDRIFEIIIDTSKFRSISTISKEKLEEIAEGHIILFLNRDLGKYKFINYKDNKVEYIIISKELFETSLKSNILNLLPESISPNFVKNIIDKDGNEYIIIEYRL